MKQTFTVGELLLLIEKSYDNPKALSRHTPTGWRSLTTQQMITEVKHLALGLISQGLKKGEMVGILALPTSRWTIADLAIMAAGGVSVPLFANISEENFQFEVRQTEMRKVFVGDPESWVRLEENRDLFDVAISLDAEPGMKTAIGYEELLAAGEKYDREHPGFYLQHLKEIRPEDIATIIYTSGSTGVPKGAVHTHHSIFSLLHCPIFNWNSKEDVYLSFLPLAHVFARVLNFIMLAWGISIYYYNDVKTIAVACQEIHPSVMVVVPRLLEKMYGKMNEKVESGSGLKKIIGKAAFTAANAANPTILQRLFRPIYEKLVYSKLRAALGGRLRIVFSGGAALNPALYRFYLNAGFPFYEGWGLTEACPITVNRVEKIKIGTVGCAIPGMNVFTSPDGELVATGEMMMKGYYKNPELTAKAFDEQGRLRTGDKGTIDEEGYVTILGRFKELLKTSTGEMIAPVPIEQALVKAPFVDMAMVVGDNKKFAACLIVPDFEYLKNLKAKFNQTHVSDEDFLKSPQMHSEVDQLLHQVNQKLNRWEKIQAFRFIPKQLTIENGEMTPSMKIKREVVEAHYKKLIDSIYEEEHA